MLNTSKSCHSNCSQLGLALHFIKVLISIILQVHHCSISSSFIDPFPFFCESPSLILLVRKEVFWFPLSFLWRVCMSNWFLILVKPPVVRNGGLLLVLASICLVVLWIYLPISSFCIAQQVQELKCKLGIRLLIIRLHEQLQ